MQDLTFYALATLAAFAVGLSKGGLQMVGVLGVPLLALVIPPVAAAAMLLPIFIVSDLFGLWVYRHAYNRRNIAILLPAMTLGIAIGWATASITNDRLVKLLLGVIALAFCVNALVRRGNIAPKPADVPRGLLWGTIAGFTSFVSHAGGPPYQIYVLPQKMEKMEFAGTSTILFAIVNALKIPPYWQLGEFNPGNVETALLLSPVAVAGAFAGYQATRWIPEKLFFRVIEALLALVSVKLIWDAVAPSL
ncbi:MAG: sulfite exporter TauE/SafE family protein [Rhizobiales bacterium]|nr:sulfite exporter TauE/SafE family protein [Hyphomicrobiales bacterium]